MLGSIGRKGWRIGWLEGSNPAAAIPSSPSELLDPHVLELDGHSRPGVELKGEDAALGGLVAVVDHLGGDVAVDLVDEVRAAGDDDVLVPVVLADGLLKLLGGHRQLFFLLGAAGFESDLRAALGEDAAAHFLVVNA